MPRSVLSRARVALVLLPLLPLVPPSAGAGVLAAQAAPRAPLSAPVADLRFEVSLGALEAFSQQLGVRATFRVEGREPVLLSLPAWTPGAYEIADFARHVSQFTATQGGRALRWDKLDPDTWRIQPDARGTVELRYTVRADSLDTAASWTRDDFGFFNGTNVFLMVEGRIDTPARVVVRTESTWRVTTSMAPADSQHAYRATDFHDLVDHPFFVGVFDLDSAEVAGRWMRLATYPAGSVEGARRTALWDALRRSVPPIVEVFGELPWERYTVLQVAEPGFPGMGALEHALSELAIVGTEYLDAAFVPSIHAHELVHAWNVKRLRPADLFPYRYDAAQPTTWLWMSEGVTDYYADLAQVRGGVTDEATFLATVLGKIDGVEQRPATALEDASLQAWLSMTDGTADLYYDKGSLAGLALDIVIRDASDNARSLDDVMRELWEVSWKRGRGFTYDEFWNAATRAAAGRALRDFERRYIDGRESYPWDQWLPLAGWRIVTDSISEPRLGALLRADPRGVRVTAIDSAAAGARAGLRVDDVITAIGGRPTLDPEFGERWRGFWGKRPGAPMALEVWRDGTTLTLTATVEITTLIDRHIAPDPAATERARRIRAGILRGAAAQR
ncbi:MAG: M61 family metallopeptidase [Gemmatimonadetes bacterium]|nr:M61 family metallopeptidase [Gemmatimonadota bacterium]